MSKKPTHTAATKWLDDLYALCEKMPRGPTHETAILRHLAKDAPDAGGAMIFLTTLNERPKP